MTVIILSSLGVVLFIIGVFFAVRAYASLPSADHFVPRSEYELLKKTLDAAKASELKAQANFSAASNEADEIKRQLEMTKSSEESLRRDLERIRKDWENFKDADERQLAATLVQLEELKSENQSLVTRALELEAKIVDQAQGSLQIIKALEAKNNALRPEDQEPPPGKAA